MYLFSKNKYVEISLHIIFWIWHFITRLMMVGYFNSFHSYELNTQLIILPVRIALTYFTVYVIIYRYLFNKKYGSVLIWWLASFLTAIVAQRIIYFYILYPYSIYPQMNDVVFLSFKIFLKQLIWIYPVVILSAGYVILKKWYEEQRLSYVLAKEKLATELKYLKAQIHPHFLFNTINNIYSLALERSEKTAPLLLKLSDLLSFMIYESSAEKISLTKEINLIEDYIELEKIRYGERLAIQFDKRGDYGNLLITPLIFLPLVENSFKHGASESIGNAWIKINLSVEKNSLIFTVENSKKDCTRVSKEINEEGIGIKNLKKRLELMYKDKFKFDTVNGENSFLAVLKIYFE